MRETEKRENPATASTVVEQCYNRLPLRNLAPVTSERPNTSQMWSHHQEVLAEGEAQLVFLDSL